MADWIPYVILAVVAVNLFWFVVLPVLRTGGSALPPEQLPAQARLDIEEQIRLGNTRQAIALLRQAHPMSERRAAHTVATWSRSGTSPAPASAALGSPAPTTAIPVVHTAPRELPPAVHAQIDRLVRADEKIAAIKVLRDATGLGLADAKHRIDGWTPGGSTDARGAEAAPAPAIAVSPGTEEPASIRAALPPSVADEIDRLVASDQKITAIKLLREHSPLGLKESKRLIDAWRPPLR